MVLSTNLFLKLIFPMSEIEITVKRIPKIDKETRRNFLILALNKNSKIKYKKPKNVEILSPLRIITNKLNAKKIHNIIELILSFALINKIIITIGSNLKT